MSSRLPAVMAGRTVLVTAHRRSEELAEAFARRGANVRHAAAMSIIEHADDDQLLTATRGLLADPPDTLVVTTGVGLRGWLAAAESAGLQEDLLRMLTGVRVLARGPKTRGALVAHGIEPDWVAASETSAEIIEHLREHGVAGTHVAVQLHGNGADGIDDAVVAAGARVTPFVVYRWAPPPDPQAVTDSVHAAAAGAIDVVVFTSAPAASAWLAAADTAGVTEQVVARSVSGELLIAAVGPVTAVPLEAKGVTPLVPERSRMGALVRAVLAHFGEVDG